MKLFTTTLCSACFTIKKLLPENHNIEIINLQDNPEAIETYGILSVPTLVDDNGNKYTVPFEIIQRIKDEYAK